MNKSERYQFAMLATVDSELPASVKLEIIETLLNDKSLAEWVEEHEGDAK